MSDAIWIGITLSTFAFVCGWIFGTAWQHRQMMREIERLQDQPMQIIESRLISKRPLHPKEGDQWVDLWDGGRQYEWRNGDWVEVAQWFPDLREDRCNCLSIFSDGYHLSDCPEFGK